MISFLNLKIGAPHSHVKCHVLFQHYYSNFAALILLQYMTTMYGCDCPYEATQPCGRVCGFLALHTIEISSENHTWAGTHAYNYPCALLLCQNGSKTARNWHTCQCRCSSPCVQPCGSQMNFKKCTLSLLPFNSNNLHTLIAQNHKKYVILVKKT